MCGIAGCSKKILNKENFILSLNTMVRRGPDAYGYYEGSNFHFGHRRLSVIDLSLLGSQPYTFKNLVLVFNGEIYNYIEIRHELIKLGYTFESNSDTEVLIKSFKEWREKAVSKFIGMFAFVIYDMESEEFFLFRDRLGVKPLYYLFNDLGFVFASELKFFRKTKLNFSIDIASISQYFRFGYITNNNTIFNEIKKVLPGHYILYKGGEFHEKKYWNPFDKIENTDFKYNDEDRVMDDLEKLLTSSFQYRMVSDVPVGIFLSGGIDSSLVSSILQKSYGNINTFTIGFDNPRYNEAVYAKEVAKYIGSRHHEFILEAKKAKEYLYNFYDIYDEPFSDSSGIPTVLISEICRKEGVKVVLSADGGDELFCGYTHYEKIAKRKLKLDATSYTLKKIQQASIKYTQQSGILRKSILFNLEHKVLTYLDMLSAQDDISLYETSISNQSSEELKYLLVKESQFKSTRYEGNTKFFLEKMMLWDLLHYLPDDLLVKVDRATMYNSIEGREPFLDHRIVEYSLNLPLHYKIRNGNNKYILKKILSRYIPSHLYDRPKKGFSIPIFQWFNEDLNHLFSEYITEEKLNKIEVLNTAEVMREMKKYNFYAARNQEYNIEKMWRTLSFIMWWDKWNN